MDVNKTFYPGLPYKRTKPCGFEWRVVRFAIYDVIVFISLYVKHRRFSTWCPEMRCWIFVCLEIRERCTLYRFTSSRQDRMPSGQGSKFLVIFQWSFGFVYAEDWLLSLTSKIDGDWSMSYQHTHSTDEKYVKKTKFSRETSTLSVAR